MNLPKTVRDFMQTTNARLDLVERIAALRLERHERRDSATRCELDLLDRSLSMLREELAQHEREAGRLFGTVDAAVRLGAH